MTKQKRYAEQTKVPVSRSKAEVERLLTGHGAHQFGIYGDSELGITVIMCKLGERMLRFEVVDPDPEDFFYHSGGDLRTEVQLEKAVAQETRRRWRALVLIIKAKLEIIASGDSTVDREFMAHVMLPDKRTMEQAMTPALDAAYMTGEMPSFPLLSGKAES